MMRYLMIIFVAVMVAIGCSDNTHPHPGVQINDSLMYISSNPIKGKPVTFWHSLSDPRRKLLQEALSWRYGPPGITITPEDNDPVVLSNVEVSSARLARKITVKQGNSVLYSEEQDVTRENVDSLSSCTVDSTEWEDIALTDEDVAFSVDYWRYYETEYGRGGNSIVSDMVKVPVLEK